ncbi:MAG: hypothetical protein RLZZ557_1679 [Bacteroidota bacterium]
MKKLLLLSAGIFALFASQAQTQILHAQVGTTGVGLGYQIPISSNISAYTSLNYMKAAPSLLLKGSDNQYRVKGIADFMQFEMAVKWHPNAYETSYGETNSGRFFVKAGLALRNTGEYQLNSDFQDKRPGNAFDPLDTKTKSQVYAINTALVQPFALVGWQLLNEESPWTLEIEGGITYHGRPEATTVNAASGGKGITTGTTSSTRVSGLIGAAQVYPVLRLNMGMKF